MNALELLQNSAVKFIRAVATMPSVRDFEKKKQLGKGNLHIHFSPFLI